ncbi:MAG: LLM class flavin-dependent oxidoreductase, partial [Gammaproteobacteria bacterium]|nr:LLM class flavin-dependent oxidoreductase [Gammaproteobacteria bacterium]
MANQGLGLNVGLNVMTSPGDQNPIETAIWAEQNGYESVWMTDGGGRMDAFTAAGAIAARTERIRVGLSIVPVFTRPVAVFATSSATLSHIAPDRIAIGVGSSSQTMIESWYGTPFVKPLTRVKETATALRQILTGEKTTFEGETISVKNFRLGIPTKGKIPLFIAALRPKMLEAAGELADGVILNLAPPQVLPRMLEHIDTGAKRSGRRVEDLEIASLLNVIVTDDESAALASMNRFALGYYSAGVYNKFLSWMGYEKEAKQIQEGFAERD